MLKLKAETNLIWILLAIFSVATAPVVTFASNTPQGAAALFINGPDGITKSLALKATKEASGPQPVDGFKLGIDNVVSVPLNGIATVFGDVAVQFTGAKLTPAGTEDTLDFPIVNGKIDFAGVAEGVYTLNVIVSDTFAYECIVVIGQDTAEQRTIVTKEITDINTNTVTDVKIVFEKGKSKPVLDKKKVCLFTPDHPVCAPVDGKCPTDFAMNEDGNCYPNKISCPPGYGRLDDDETGACRPLPTTPPLTPELPCTEGSTYDPVKGECVLNTTPTPTPTPAPQALVQQTPTPNPEPTTCEAGFILENGKCTEMSSNCGGEPCTPSQKEDSTTENPIPGTSEPQPEPQPEPEPESEEEQSSSDSDGESESDTGSDGESSGN